MSIKTNQCKKKSTILIIKSNGLYRSINTSTNGTHSFLLSFFMSELFSTNSLKTRERLLCKTKINNFNIYITETHNNGKIHTFQNKKGATTHFFTKVNVFTLQKLNCSLKEKKNKTKKTSHKVQRWLD